MIVKIDNERIQVGIDTLGAELKSLQCIEDGHEYMWPGSETSWKGSSPILFPIIGAVNDDKYSYEGETYEIPSHGFGRRSEFSVTSQTFDSVTFSLVDNERTLEVFPFEFLLNITYTIKHDELIVSYEVNNRNSGDMLFSIGAHPGFNCPLEEGLSFSDYRLVFDKKESSQRRFKVGKVLSGERGPLFDNEDTLRLEHDDYRDGALIFDDLRSQKVTLMSPKGTRKVHMDFSGFPYFGIWTFPQAPQDYLCLEPWYGIDSTAGDALELDKKEGLVHLGPGEVFKAAYTIRIE